MTEESDRKDFLIGERASFGKTITEADISTFADLVGDFNPIHVDAEYARKSRFGRRIAHGMFAGGLISAVRSWLRFQQRRCVRLGLNSSTHTRSA